MYCTPEQLADANLAEELAQVCTPLGLPQISAALMEATLRGTDRTGTSSEDLASADAALRTIETALNNAGSFIDGYLRSRTRNGAPAPYTVPLHPVPDQVQVWALWIGRYLVHKNLNSGSADSQIVRDYKEAVRFLEMVQAGKFSLGGDDPLPPAAGGVPPQVEPGCRTFTRESLRDFAA